MFLYNSSSCLYVRTYPFYENLLKNDVFKLTCGYSTKQLCFPIEIKGF